jgi:hypothetical protein
MGISLLENKASINIGEDRKPPSFPTAKSRTPSTIKTAVAYEAGLGDNHRSEKLIAETSEAARVNRPIDAAPGDGTG